MKRRVLLGAPLLLAGCNRSKRKTVAVIPKATSHLFWQSVHAGANAAGKELDVDVEWNGPALETDYSRQIQIVDSMIARRVDGIAVAASDRKALSASLDRAAQLKIPVTVFDSGVDSDQYMTFVATNNYEVGQMGARKMAELLGGKGTVAVLMHAPGSYSTMDREQGFEDVIAKEFPGIKIVAKQYGMSDPSKARAAGENILTAFPSVGGIFASTEPSGTGALLALKGRGLGGKVRLVCVDASEDLVKEMRAGVVDALVVQDPFKIGFEAVRTIVEKLKGGQPPKKMDLRGVVITKQNVDTPEMQALLNPDLKKYL